MLGSDASDMLESLLRRIIYHIISVELVGLIVSQAGMCLVVCMSLSATESLGRLAFPFVSLTNLSLSLIPSLPTLSPQNAEGTKFQSSYLKHKNKEQSQCGQPGCHS